MEYNGLIWVVRAIGPNHEMVYWAFSPSEVLSIVDELAQNDDRLIYDIELTQNPNEDGVYESL